MNSKLINFMVAAVLSISGVVAQAASITSTGFFGAGDTVINFDTFPDVAGTPVSGTALTTQYASLGVRFSSEDVVGAFQTTDPADANGRFGASMLVLAAQSGGGVPKSAPRYASGLTYLGTLTSDMRIDFAQPVSAFGMWTIDNDASTARLQAFSSTGTLIESLVVPQVGEGGSVFHGIDAGVSGTRIAYVILDGNNGASLDSTFIDDLYIRVTPVPEPGTASVVLVGMGLVGGRRGLQLRAAKRREI